MKIAFIGLGAMGAPMAQNLVRKGHAVRGFDLRPAALVSFREGGGEGFSTAAEACQEAEAIILMVVNLVQAESVLFDDGALAALDPGALVLLMSTCPPSAVSVLGRRIGEGGWRFLDCPVSGGVVGARSAGLTIIAAGTKDTFEAAMPLLEALGDKIHHVGTSPGQGAMIKTVNQLLCGVHIAACAEAFAMAEKIGVEKETLLAILSNSAASSWMVRDRGPRMIQDNPVVTSTIDIFVKDLSIVLEAGRETKSDLPLAFAAFRKFTSTSDAGDGNADDSQVIRAYRSQTFV